MESCSPVAAAASATGSTEDVPTVLSRFENERRYLPAADSHNRAVPTMRGGRTGHGNRLLPTDRSREVEKHSLEGRRACIPM